ncbi:uncharacterized protein LOC131067349 [Cryptomeria japonica]|uniref:uncharacterized protein LOC131067349 n=1 Tax=Cryptomeria japonica TaxID=3369 RepID=UPI0027DA7ABF|nr:uncharacterized protein LOC131067349 [Cryptomeria japonica]XP_059077609.1 uncharacterized protein LOC131067349 [Cryptomeria japonica]
MGDDNAKKESKDDVSPFGSLSAVSFDVFMQQKVEANVPAPKPKFQPKVKIRNAAQKPSASSKVKKEKEKEDTKTVVTPKLEAPVVVVKQEVPDADDIFAVADGDTVMNDVVKKEETEYDFEVKDVDMEVKLEEGAEVKMEEEVGIKDEPISPVLGDAVEDKVVREIDVYLTPSIDPDTKLYLMQYPLRPYWRPYGLKERCEEVRVKCKQSRLEVDLVLDTDEENYDHDAKEHLKITKQTLTSSKTPLSTGHALGILRGNKLHLSPVHAAVQLRTHLGYVNKGEEHCKKIVADEENEEEPQEAKPELVPLKVELKKETERQEKMRLQSHAYIKQLDEAEPWIPLEAHGIDSPVTDTIRQKMVAVENFQIPFSMNPYDYVNTLVPGRTSTSLNEAKINEDNGNEGFSRSFLDTLPLEQRFEVLLSKGRVQVLQFERLMRLAPAGSTEQEVLDVLQQYALLVQGCWVPASPLRYNGEICKVRDYILLLFNKNRLVRYEQLEELKVPKETLREVLVSLAIQRPATGGWEFQESTDRSFIKSHQNIVKEQNQRWSENEDGIRNAALNVAIRNKDKLKSADVSLQNSDKGVTGSMGSMKPSMNGAQQGIKSAKVADCGQVASRGVGNGDLSVRTMAEETRAALPGALREILANRVCNLSQIRQSLQNLAKEKLSAQKLNPKAVAAAVAASKGASAPEPELKSVIDQVATNINSVYFLSSLGNKDLDPFRNVVIALLRTKGPGTAIRKVDINEACKIKLGIEVPQPVYNKVMKELCISKGGGWVLKTGDGRPE